MPVSKKRVKKVKKQSKPNVRRMYRNDARRIMQRMLAGYDLAKKNCETFKVFATGSQEKMDLLAKVQKIVEDAHKLLVETDAIAQEIHTSTKLELPLQTWVSEHEPVISLKAMSLEQALDTMANYVEATLLVISSAIGLEGATASDGLGLDFEEIKSKEDLEGVAVPGPDFIHALEPEVERGITITSAD